MDLLQMRELLNDIDLQLVGLFSKRMNTASAIAEYKMQHNMPVVDSAREREILNRVAELSGETLEQYTKRLFYTLFDLSRSHQGQLFSHDSLLAKEIEAATLDLKTPFPSKATVACQGTEGSYSQQASEKLFSLPNLIFFNSFDDVFQAVEKGLCEFGVLPVENSLAGTVVAVYDLMKKHKFHIVRSVKLGINHTLLANKGVDFNNIKEIVSHEQAINQCSEFLKAHPQIKVTVFSNTAAAANYVAKTGRSDLAAISSRHCAEIYNLNILSNNIQNRDNNYTRFICISKRMKIFPGANKISLMLSIPHKPGSLYTVIAKFASLGFNLTKLESRPIVGRDFEFMFYFDFEASIYLKETVNLLCELQSSLEQFVFLGSYSEID
ncbi:MAG: prephenate dehydratase domain-containing protein [Bacillota bacterium]|nr:prephenate dehydratase domain-containing protein [Bacillota bacterium]